MPCNRAIVYLSVNAGANRDFPPIECFADGCPLTAAAKPVAA